MPARQGGIFGVGEADKSQTLMTMIYFGSLRRLLVPLHILNLLCWENWHHPSFRIKSLSLTPPKMAGLLVPFLKVSGCGKRSSSQWGNYGYASRRTRRIRLWMRLQDQHKLHCRPKHVFPRCFGLCLSPWYALLSLPSSFPCRAAPSWTSSMVLGGCWCLFEVLLCYLGSFRREVV